MERDLRALLKKVSAQEYLVTAVTTLLEYEALEAGEPDLLDKLEAEVVMQAKAQGVMTEG